MEIGNALSKKSHRAAAVQILESIYSDPKVDAASITENLYKRGLGLFRERPDKEWGLTDCISFVVMEDRRVTDALTADEHCIQAGFKALLRS